MFLGTYVPFSLRWRTLTSAVGYDLSLSQYSEIVAVSAGLNKLLPAKSGDLARSKINQRYVVVRSHPELLGMVAIKQLLDILTWASFLVIVAPFLPVSGTTAISDLTFATILPLIMGLALVGFLSVRILFFGCYPPSIRNMIDKLLFGYPDLPSRTHLTAFSYSLLRWELGSAISYHLQPIVSRNWLLYCRYPREGLDQQYWYAMTRSLLIIQTIKPLWCLPVLSGQKSQRFEFDSREQSPRTQRTRTGIETDGASRVQHCLPQFHIRELRPD